MTQNKVTKDDRAAAHNIVAAWHEEGLLLHQRKQKAENFAAQHRESATTSFQAKLHNAVTHLEEYHRKNKELQKQVDALVKGLRHLNSFSVSTEPNSRIEELLAKHEEKQNDTTKHS